MKILGYITLILIQIFSIQFIPTVIIGGLLGRLTKNMIFGMFIGSIFSWFLLNFAYICIFKENLPLLGFAISLIFQIIHLNILGKELTENSKKMIIAE